MHGGGRDLERRSGLVVGEASKEEQFDQVALAAVVDGEALHGIVEFNQTAVGLRSDHDGVIETNFLEFAPALLPVLGTGVIDQDAPQDTRGNGIEVNAIHEGDIGIDELEIGFVDQRRGPQGVIPALGAQAVQSQLAQLVVDDRHQPVDRLFIAFTPLLQQLRDLLALGLHESTPYSPAKQCLAAKPPADAPKKNSHAREGNRRPLSLNRLSADIGRRVDRLTWSDIIPRQGRAAAGLRRHARSPKTKDKDKVKFSFLREQRERITMKTKYFASVLSLAVLFLMSSAFAQTYTYNTVNYTGDTFTQLLGVNNSGIVAGYHGTTNKGFTYTISSKTFTSENFPGSAQTQVIGINNDQKTSGFFVSSKGRVEGFTYSGKSGGFTPVNYPGSAFNQLLSQNDIGQAAGYYSLSTSGAPDTAYVYDEFGGVFEVFYIPGSTNAQATGINNSSEVCGFFVDKSGNMHGWLKIQGHFTQLDYPGSSGTTAALGLNNKGQVVGSYADSSGNTHGFLYNVTKHTWQSLDDPSGIGVTVTNGINDDGVLVGFYGPVANGAVCGGSDCSGFVATPE